jgi:hypothetical protein
MSRQNVTTAMLDATQASQLLPAIFVQATMASGTVYLWSGFGNLTWNGQTWQGVGSMLRISTIEEKATVTASGITVTLSGIDPTLLNDVLGEFQLFLAMTTRPEFGARKALPPQFRREPWATRYPLAWRANLTDPGYRLSGATSLTWSWRQ